MCDEAQKTAIEYALVATGLLMPHCVYNNTSWDQMCVRAQKAHTLYRSTLVASLLVTNWVTYYAVVVSSGSPDNHVAVDPKWQTTNGLQFKQLNGTRAKALKITYNTRNSLSPPQHEVQQLSTREPKVDNYNKIHNVTIIMTTPCQK